MTQDNKLSSTTAAIPDTKVTVYEALYRRRMSWDFQDRPVAKEVVERMLSTAVWAPNHRLTEPWRFFVVNKDSAIRNTLGDMAFEASMERNNNPDRAEKTRQAQLDPPILIYVYTVPGANESATTENYASVCCAVQNISLAGVAEGLAVTWETGGITRHPRLNETLGADAEWSLVGLLSVGIPAGPLESRRTSAENFTAWV
jgi:nitroreductase